jgi:3-hydroxybutyryl-CoA dehydratase
MLTHIGGLLGFLATEMSFEYLAPVFVGDSVSCTVTVVEKDEAKRRVVARAGFINQDGFEVLRARFSGFPGRIRLAR